MTKADEIVSIIVPVFNAELYLAECIQSICLQTHPHLEVILVNDGSTDKSGDICANFSKRDDRIHVIHQENKGPSAARNKGMQAASGTYVQFVDADDTIRPTMTEQLLRRMDETTDLVICGYETNGIKMVSNKSGVFSQKQFSTNFGSFYRDAIFPSPCNKMYRLQTIQKNNLTFNEQFSYGEDFMFNLRYLTHCRFIFVLPQILYHYRKNEYSLTNSYIPDMFEQQKILHEQIKDFLQTNDCHTKENTRITETIFANSFIHATTNIFHPSSMLSKLEKRKLITQILNDITVQEQLPYFTDSLEAKLFRSFVLKKRFKTAYLYFTLKEGLRFRFKGVFTLLQRLNKSRLRG